MRNLLVLLAAVIALGLGAGAQAHTKSETQTLWRIVGDRVHLTFNVPDIEAKRLTPDSSQPSQAQLANYLAGHVSVSNGGQECKADAPRSDAAVDGFQRIEFAFQCAGTDDLTLTSSAFFDLVPTHVTFAQIVPESGNLAMQLITKDAQSVALGGEEHGLADASFFEYVLLGIDHILTGIDHMAFLLGLVLISRRLRDLVFVVTGFTLGHSVTLALAVLGILRPHAEYIDALVALTIALIGIENLGLANRRSDLVAVISGIFLLGLAAAGFLGFGNLPPLLLLGAGIFSASYLMLSGHLQDAGRIRLVVTLVFGLIHGFGFAASLLDMRLPPSRIAELLVGFNLGVEIGQLALVAAVSLLVMGLARLRLTLPRPIVVDVSGSFLVAIGLFWFVTRSY